MDVPMWNTLLGHHQASRGTYEWFGFGLMHRWDVESACNMIGSLQEYYMCYVVLISITELIFFEVVW